MEISHIFEQQGARKAILVQLSNRARTKWRPCYQTWFSQVKHKQQFRVLLVLTCELEQTGYW